MVEVRSDSKITQVVPTSGEYQAEHKYVFIPDLADAASSKQQEIDRLHSQLPARQGTEGNINFLGSSYTGVDLKVVAHLYDNVSWVGDKIFELEAKRLADQLVADGATNLVSGGLDGLARQEIAGSLSDNYARRREFFIAATGLKYPGGEENDRAVNQLVSGIFKNGSFTFIGIAKMKQRAEYFKQIYTASAKGYQDRLDNLEAAGAADPQSSDTVVLGTLQTISVQSFREKNAVRALGHSYAKGYTRGTVTTAGSMIFTIFNEHALTQMITAMGNSRTYGERDTELSTLRPDQLPPIDLTLIFANEYGALSDLRLYGVEFVTDGQVYSIEDLLSEGTMNFVCRDADILTSRGRIRISRLQRGMFNDKDDKDISGSSLLFDNDAYYEYLGRLGTRRRLTGR